MKRHFTLAMTLTLVAAGFLGCGSDPATSPNRQGLYGTQSTFYAPAETVVVPVDGSAVSSAMILESGKTYKLRASGTFTIGVVGDGLADAEYADFSNPPASLQDHCANDPAGVDLGIGIDDAVIDSIRVPNWGPFDPTHVYTIDWAGADAALSLNYHDCDYEDNSGSLTVVVWSPFEFDIDIKPGSTKNPINVGSQGVIPVAILGSVDFDVMDVDVASLAFGPGGAPEAHGKGHPEDVNEDGHMDLMLHFRTQATGVVDGDTQLCLHGMTLGGVELQDCDTITTVPEDKPEDGPEE